MYEKPIQSEIDDDDSDDGHSVRIVRLVKQKQEPLASKTTVRFLRIKFEQV